MKKKKAQAAIEFLTTYSWAIMGILLTIGALTYFDVFNTNRFISERCDTGAQINCAEAALTEQGTFYIRLINNYPVDIDIESIRIEIPSINYNFAQTSFTTSTINRGETETFQIDTLQSFFRTRETIDLTITFKRSGGTNEYNITGVTVVRPIDGSMII